MTLSLVDLPLELLSSILDFVPVYHVEKYALTCKLLFSISYKFIKRHALQRTMYSSIYCGNFWNEYGMNDILETLVEPERCVYARDLCVDLNLHLPAIVNLEETLPSNTEEEAIYQTYLILDQVSQTLPRAMVRSLSNDSQEYSADVVTALALVRLINLTKLDLIDDGNGIYHTLDMIGHAAMTQWGGGGAILQHLAEISIHSEELAENSFGNSCGVIMSLPSLRKLMLLNLLLDRCTTWSKLGVAPLSCLGLSNCRITRGMLREILCRLQHLKVFVFECEPGPDSCDGFVNMWHVSGIIRESGLQSSLISLTLKHIGVDGPYCTHMGSLHDFDNLEILETDFKDADVDDSTFPHIYDSDRLYELSAPLLKTLRLRCFMNTVNQGLRNFSLRIRLLVGKFLRQMPTLRHLDIDCQHVLLHDDENEMFRMCEEAGVVLTIRASGSAEYEISV